MKPNNDERIDETLKSLGVCGPYEQETYVAEMESQYGAKACRFMDAVDALFENENATPDDWHRVYALKNADQEMSLFVSSHQSTDMYRSLLRWLLENVQDTPRSIAELGCDVGVLSLALARLYPQTRVIGIDSVGLAVSNAKKIARKHGIENASFVKTDLCDRPGKKLPEAELVLAPWVLHETLRSIVGKSYGDDSELRFLQNVASLVVPGGALVTVNRIPFPDSQVPMLEKLFATVGLRSTLTDLIVAREGDTVARFPVVCFELG